MLAVGNDGQWQHFCQAADRANLGADPRFLTNTERVRRRAELVPLVEELMRSRTTAEWERLLRAAEVPHAPVWNYADLFSHPQTAARGLHIQVSDPHGRPVDLLGPPFHIDGAAPPSPTMPPALGQHTDEVLREVLGLDEERIAELRRRGVI